MDSKFFLSYLAPDAEVVTVAVEHGFDGSSNLENLEPKPEKDWN
jgi:hypothetical protein